MRKPDLAHILCASAAILDEREFVVIGSQSIWGTTDQPPPECQASMEADLYPLRHPHKAEVLSAAIGELSHFHQTFGYYAEGVSPKLPVLPEGWRGRLRKVEGEGAVGWCLSAQDLAIAKYAAGREKDAEFNKALVRARLVHEGDLLRLVNVTPFKRPEDADRVKARIRADFQSIRQENAAAGVSANEPEDGLKHPHTP